MGTMEKNESLDQQILEQREYLLNCAKKILRNHHDAEDIVQDTLIRALRFQDKFDGRYLRSWLFTILKRLSINKFHKDQRDKENRAKLLQFEIYSDVSDITSDEINATQVVERVRRGIDKLPESFKPVARAVLLDGYSYQETSDALRIPLGTVMSRLYRARLLLRAELSNGEDD